jgi:outer membrane biosynthesis protein TonB
MEPRQFIRPDILASVIAHVSILALLILAAEVHPFQAVPSETIAVDLVTPAEVEKKPEPTPTPEIPLPDLSKSAQPATPAAAPQPAPQPAAPQQAAATQPLQRQSARSAPREPAAQPQPPPSPQPPSAASSPGYTPPEPDITVKYHVVLGLPEALPSPAPSPPTSSGDKPGDGGADATASTPADVASSLIAEFRRHLRSCSKLPASIARSDEIEIKLRVFMTPEGRLAAAPNPVGVKHPSENGPALLQSAVAALQACQPYTMLPKDRYGEWKVIDLIFTPQDFSGG